MCLCHCYQFFAIGLDAHIHSHTVGATNAKRMSWRERLTWDWKKKARRSYRTVRTNIAEKTNRTLNLTQASVTCTCTHTQCRQRCTKQSKANEFTFLFSFTSDVPLTLLKCFSYNLIQFRVNVWTEKKRWYFCVHRGKFKEKLNDAWI